MNNQSKKSYRKMSCDAVGHLLDMLESFGIKEASDWHMKVTFGVDEEDDDYIEPYVQKMLKKYEIQP